MKKEINYSKIFTRYLKEKGLFKQFELNFNNVKQQAIRVGWCKTAVGRKFKGEPDATFEDYCSKINDCKIFLAYAFDWSKTKQGHAFWEDESNKWSLYLVKEFNYI